MVSIIVCSKSEKLLAQVGINVAATIGVPYEIISIDNREGKYGICEAYNHGAMQAKYELLCFMHEDVAFHTPDWGAIVAEILADHSIGVIGVAGGMHILDAPSGWWSVYEYQRMQVIQTTPAYPRSLDVINPLQEELANVAAVDGLWLCSRKAVWEQHPFDEQTFPAFHFYDLDYCTQVFQHLRICVTFRILIEHFSTGSINTGWLLTALQYQRKWQKSLPFGVVEIPAKQQAVMRKRISAEFTDRIIQSNLSFWLALKQTAIFFAASAISRESLGMIKRFVQKRLLNQDVKIIYK